jgi:hypothetical protein
MNMCGSVSTGYWINIKYARQLLTELAVQILKLFVIAVKDNVYVHVSSISY